MIQVDTTNKNIHFSVNLCTSDDGRVVGCRVEW